MRITFHIQELGRLKDTSFDLHPFLIFTGDSNLGKSYCAFLVYGFLKSLETELFTDFIGKIVNLETTIEKLKKGEKIDVKFYLKDIEIFFNENAQAILGSLIGYEEVNCKVSLKFQELEDITITTIYDEFHNSYLVATHERTWTISQNTKAVTDTVFWRSCLGNLIKIYLLKKLDSQREFSFNNTFIFPPARGSILSFPYTMQKAVSSNMRMYSKFLTDMDKLREPSFGKKAINKEVLTKLKEIMAGEIKIRQNEIHYQFDNQSIPLTAAASSIKELAPLFLLLKKEEPNEISLLFEEPESHLHPAMQKKLADLLAYMVNKGAFLQITTHSSYFLTEWNNLLRLHFIREKSQECFETALAETHIPADCVLSPEKVGAYYFHVRQDGSVELRKSEITEQSQIQFDTFNDTVTELNENRYILMEKLAELTEKEHEREN
ncbi:MAG: AAA family ATPase [Bacteroidia bacterium]